MSKVIVKEISAHPQIGCLTIQCGGKCVCIYCSNNKAMQLSRAENGKNKPIIIRKKLF